MPSSMSQATCTWLIHNFMLFGLEREKNDGNIVRKEACRTKLPFDAGPTLKQHWVNAPCLLGYLCVCKWQSKACVHPD